MKFCHYAKWSLLICLLVLPMVSGAEDKVEVSPSYTVPEKQFTFQPVVDGAEIVHDFTIQNKGTTELSVLNVKTG
jgi:hypothetical protein